jgi:DNA-binding NarL/FixJ family response regulator
MRRLVIIAEHSLIVDAIRLALRQTAGFRIVGCVDGRHPVGAQLADLQPDVVLVDDMRMPERALARTREVAEYAPVADCLLLTLRMDDDWLTEAFEAGATAVFSKTVHRLALGTLLRETVEGNVVHRPRASRAASTDECPLTPRELEILRLVAQGMTNGQIARQLWVTEQTVKFHLSNTYRKLGVANRTEATRYAYMNELVTPHEQLAA